MLAMGTSLSLTDRGGGAIVLALYARILTEDCVGCALDGLSEYALAKTHVGRASRARRLCGIKVGQIHKEIALFWAIVRTVASSPACAPTDWPWTKHEMVSLCTARL
jgi:hypothetical protein